MARRKMTLEHNATKCLIFPSYSYHKSFRNRNGRLPDRCYLSTSHALPNHRTNKQPNPHNALQPPLTSEQLKEIRKNIKNETNEQRARRVQFLAPDVDFGAICTIMDAMNVEGEWERGCCLVHGTKKNDKFDIECSDCVTWWHSSCLVKKYGLKKADINRINKMQKSADFKNEQWHCPNCENGLQDENKNNNVDGANDAQNDMNVDSVSDNEENIEMDVPMSEPMVAIAHAMPVAEPQNVSSSSNVRPLRRSSRRRNAR